MTPPHFAFTCTDYEGDNESFEEECEESPQFQECSTTDVRSSFATEGENLAPSPEKIYKLPPLQDGDRTVPVLRMYTLEQDEETNLTPFRRGGYRSIGDTSEEDEYAQRILNMMLTGEYSRVDILLTMNVQEKDRTTVVVRNIPKAYTRDDFVHFLHRFGYDECVDFVYLPIDARHNTKHNLSYGFINFTNPIDANVFKTMFQGFSEWGNGGVSGAAKGLTKKCEVIWSTPYQGLTSQIDRYRNKPVMRDSVPDDHRPMLLFKGEPVPFPPTLSHAPPKRHRIRRRRRCTAISV